MKCKYNIEVTRKNIKNMYLRVKSTDGTVQISAPYGVSRAEIERFVNSRADWIEDAVKRLREREKEKENAPVIVPFMERQMRQELKRQIQKLIEKWEPVMGVKSAGFTIKKMKTRWGSCNVQSHHLNFNLMLARVPAECVEYVVVHELTHLLEPSHNDRFWALMEYYLPGSKGLRKQLSGFSAVDML